MPHTVNCMTQINCSVDDAVATIQAGTPGFLTVTEAAERSCIPARLIVEATHVGVLAHTDRKGRRLILSTDLLVFVEARTADKIPGLVTETEAVIEEGAVNRVGTGLVSVTLHNPPLVKLAVTDDHGARISRSYFAGDFVEVNEQEWRIVWVNPDPARVPFNADGGKVVAKLELVTGR